MTARSEKWSFDKVHVCGNDFVLLEIEPGHALSAICDRYHGIGADGVMVFRGLSRETVLLAHYDPDGSCSFCLNGIRASLDCLFKKGLVPREGRVESEGVSLAYSVSETTRVFLAKTSYTPRRRRDGDSEITGFFVDVGNPHFVVIDEKEPGWFRTVAPSIRNDLTAFPQGVNVHLVRPCEGGWRIFSFERGVEGFTKACGSGMLASGLVLMGENSLKEITFFPEGRGMVRLADMGDRIRMEGDSGWVASGVWLCGF